MDYIQPYRNRLRDSRVRAQIKEGFDPKQVFSEIDVIFPLLRSFLTA